MPDNAQELFDALSEPFPTEVIQWRIGRMAKDKPVAQALAYIDARTVMDRLDAVCGPANWKNRFSFAQAMAICNLSIRVDGEWIEKEDGAGATDVEGEKGMLSDALKRAAVHWGVGRYLYDLDTPWVAVDGKQIAKSEIGKLNEVHDRAAQKVGWGTPEMIPPYRLLVRVVKDILTQQADVIDFRERHKGMIPQLRVAMRRNFETLLDNIGSTSHKQAAE